MIAVDNEIEKRGWRNQVQLLLQIHDELIFEIKESTLSEVKPIIRKIMEGVVADKTVSFPVHATSGPSWGDL